MRSLFGRSKSTDPNEAVQKEQSLRVIKPDSQRRRRRGTSSDTGHEQRNSVPDVRNDQARGRIVDEDSQKGGLSRPHRQERGNDTVKREIVSQVLENCDVHLNDKNGPLSEFADIGNSLMSLFAGRHEKIGKLVMLRNSDANVSDRARSSVLIQRAKEWYSKKNKVKDPEIIVYKVGSKDYIGLLGEWESYSSSTSTAVITDEDSERMLHKIEEMFVAAYRNKASDIHFELRSKTALIRHRINGELREHKHLKPEEAKDIIQVLWQKIVEGQGNNFNPTTTGHSGAAERTITVDGRSENIRLRVQVLPHRSQAYDVQMRFMPTLEIGERPDLLKLGYREPDAEVLEAGIRNQDGLILFSGATGSGKTTTLATLIQMYMYLNTEPSGSLLTKIVTVEDPVEIVIPGITQQQIEGRGEERPEDRLQRYAAPIRHALRGDPDMVMVSEIRESAAANALIAAVQSGHLCLSTVHAQSAIGIIPRLTSANIGVPRDVLADKDFLRVLCNQSLVQTLCENCKVPLRDFEAGMRDRRLMGRREFYKTMIGQFDDAGLSTDSIGFRNAKGCPQCNKSGVTGVRVIAETIQPDYQLLSYIHENRNYDAFNYWVNELKGVTLMDHALMLIEEGSIDPYKIFLNYGNLKPSNFRSGMR